MSINKENNICCVMQPTFFPWIGYFDLIDSADHFIFYDDVQFVKQSWQTRNRTKTANGVISFNVPVHKNDLISNINEINVDNRKPWNKKLLKTFFYTYQKTTFFKEVYPFFEDILKKEYSKLSDLNGTIITEISNKIGIETKFWLSSNLKSLDKRKDARLVDICKELNCDSYLSTIGSSSYIEEKNPGGEFSNHNINLFYHNYSPVEYAQSFGGFEPYMSVVDLLFNEGFDNSLNIIRKGRKSFLLSNEI